MKHILVPNPIVLPALAGVPGAAELMSFSRFAAVCWLDDDRGITVAGPQGPKGSFTQQCRWAKVVDALSVAIPGAYVSLEDADYEVLRSIALEPVRRMAATSMVRCGPFTQAVLDAKDELPVTHHQEGDAAPS